MQSPRRGAMAVDMNFPLTGFLQVKAVKSIRYATA
jgi:hypothetical protein